MAKGCVLARMVREELSEEIPLGKDLDDVESLWGGKGKAISAKALKLE